MLPCASRPHTLAPAIVITKVCCQVVKLSLLISRIQVVILSLLISRIQVVELPPLTIGWADCAVVVPGVHKLVLRELLNPRHWKAPEERKFMLGPEQINELCDTAERIFREEPSVLRLRGAHGPDMTFSHRPCNLNT